jgi:tripartite-type tricarboxylate transporter receptor subunit TctC
MSQRFVSPNSLKGNIMKFPRRRFLQLAAGAVALPAVSRTVGAQTAYPTRPVRCIVGYAPGGGTDIFVRLVGQLLPSRLGQPFVIENRPGASSNLATETVIRGAADGYTLLGVDPAKTLPEFIAYAKGNPGKIAMASAGSGSTNHLAGELFKAMTGVDMTHVPYRGGGPAVADLLGGQVQVMFAALPPSIEHIRSGRLRALAVTTAMRFEALPDDLPAVADFVPGYEASQWWAVCLRKSTPAEIIERLNKEINAILTDTQLRARLRDLGGAMFAGSSADFGKFLVDDTAKWAKAVKFSAAKPE